MNKQFNYKVFIAAMIFTIISGFAFFAIKVCVSYGNSFEILAYRYTFAFLAGIVWTAIGKIKGNIIEKQTGRPIGRLWLTAGFYFGFMFFQILSMAFATSIEGTLVYAATPIFAKVIGRILLGERSTMLQNFFVGLTFVSLVVLILCNASDIDMSLPGVVLMAIASILSATSNVYMRGVRGVFQPTEISMVISAGGFVIFHGINVAHNIANHTLLQYFEPLTHPQFFISIAFLGAGSIMITTLLMSYMLIHLELIQATIFGNLSTLISIIVGAIILHEPLYWYYIVCGALIITGVLGLAIAPTRERKQ